MAGMDIGKTRVKNPNHCLSHESEKITKSSQQSIFINVPDGEAAREGATQASSTSTKRRRKKSKPKQDRNLPQQLQTAPAAAAAAETNDSFAGSKIADVVHENNLALSVIKAPSQESQQEHTTVTTHKAVAVSHADQSQNGHGARRSQRHYQSRVQRYQPQSALRGSIMSMRQITPFTPTTAALASPSALPYGHQFYYYPPPPPPGTPPSASGPMSYGGFQNGWWWYGNDNGFIAGPLQQSPAGPAMHPPMMYHQNPTSRRRRPQGQNNFQSFHAYSSWPSQQLAMHNHLTQGTPRIAQWSQPTPSNTPVGQHGGPSWRHTRIQSQTEACPETPTCTAPPLRPWAPEFVPINSLHSMAKTS